MKLNIGCGRNAMDGWVNIDSVDLPGVDIVFDLDNCANTRMMLADDSVDEFMLSHVIEHIHNPLPLMQELHRIAKPHAKLTVLCPYGSSDDADEDPTHVRRYFKGSFGYFGQPYYWRADYGYRGDWDIGRILLYLNPPWTGTDRDAQLEAINHQRNVVREMMCEMYAIKPVRPPLRELQVYPNIVMV